MNGCRAEYDPIRSPFPSSVTSLLSSSPPRSKDLVDMVFILIDLSFLILAIQKLFRPVTSWYEKVREGLGSFDAIVR